MYKKEKWEELWEEYKSNNILTIEEIEGKWESQDKEYRKRLSEVSDSTSEEYKKLKTEWKKLKAQFENEKKKIEKYKEIAKNEDKIEKAKFERDAYQSLLDELLDARKENEEIIARRTKLSDEAKKLDEELKELKYVEEHLRIALKNSNLKPEDNQRISRLLEENMAKQAENQHAFSVNQLTLQEELKVELRPIDEAEIIELKEGVDKFNAICEMLVDGKTMGEITSTLNAKKKETEARAKVDEEIKPKAKTEPKSSEETSKSADESEVENIFNFFARKEGESTETKTVVETKVDDTKVEGTKTEKNKDPKYHIEFYAKQQMYKMVYQDGIKVKIIELKLDEIASDSEHKEALKILENIETDVVDPYIVNLILKTGKLDLLNEYINSVSKEDKTLETMKIKYNMDGIYGRKYSSEISSEIMNYANIHEEKGLATVKKGRFTKFMEAHAGFRKVWERISKIGAKDKLSLPAASDKDKSEETTRKTLREKIAAQIDEKKAIKATEEKAAEAKDKEQSNSIEK